MKRPLIALGFSLLLLTGSGFAADLPTLQVDGKEVQAVHQVEQGTTYVYLRTMAEAMDNSATVDWTEGGATVRTDSLHLRAIPGRQWLSANDRCLYVSDGIKLSQGRTLVPVRVLADAFGAEVEWDAKTGAVNVASKGSIPQAGYDQDALYWLSRIISSESRGEPLAGQIAVGNVVLNRVRDGEFPNTIYGVIFDDRWGGQFEPVRNGTVYQTPAESSVVAAKLCLEGANVVGDSLYFLNPTLAGNLWVPQNRPYITTIGVHDFYR